MIPYVGFTAYTSFFVVLVLIATLEFVRFLTRTIHSDFPYIPLWSGLGLGCILKESTDLSNEIISCELIV